MIEVFVSPLKISDWLLRFDSLDWLPRQKYWYVHLKDYPFDSNLVRLEGLVELMADTGDLDVVAGDAMEKNGDQFALPLSVSVLDCAKQIISTPISTDQLLFLEYACCHDL